MKIVRRGARACSTLLPISPHARGATAVTESGALSCNRRSQGLRADNQSLGFGLKYGRIPTSSDDSGAAAAAGGSFVLLPLDNRTPCGPLCHRVIWHPVPRHLPATRLVRSDQEPDGDCVGHLQQSNRGTMEAEWRLGSDRTLCSPHRGSWTGRARTATRRRCLVSTAATRGVATLLSSDCNLGPTPVPAPALRQNTCGARADSGAIGFVLNDVSGARLSAQK
jgi:hypothetical protein